MIERFKLKSGGIPKHLITNIKYLIVPEEAPESGDWLEYKLKDEMRSNETLMANWNFLLQWCANVTGTEIVTLGNFQMRIHDLKECPEHIDNTNTSAYCIPVTAYSNNHVFYDSESRVPLQVGYVYRLNDYLPHGIDIADDDTITLITFDDRGNSANG